MCVFFFLCFSCVEQGAELGVRRLRIDAAARKSLTAPLAEFVQEHSGKTYEESIMALIRAQFKANHAEDLSSMFCSELVAASLKKLVRKKKKFANCF